MAAKIVIFTNGKARQLDVGLSVQSLVEDLNLKPNMTLVEYNGRALLRHEWKECELEHGDRLEFLRVVAGG
ncbi:MAG: sulfur carrier protein ThiS [Verrucomicrobiota bacterium]